MSTNIAESLFQQSIVHPAFFTERLDIKPLTEMDVELVAELGNDPDVAKTLIGDWSTVSKRMEFARHWLVENQSTGIWGVYDRSGFCGVKGEFLGFISTEATVPETAIGVEVFYAFKKRSWGKGVAKETIRPVVDYLFIEQSQPLVEAMVLPAVNPASSRVLEGIGMKPVGHYPISTYSGERAQDTIDYEVWRVANSSPDQLVDNLKQAAFKIGMYLGEGMENRKKIEWGLLSACQLNTIGYDFDSQTWKDILNHQISLGIRQDGWLHYRLTRREFDSQA